jgi:threonine/homoserine/homoserine lactone efflux protein
MQAFPALFLSSMMIGLSIAAPVGPIGVLCIQRTLERGRLVGLISGLGAASADTVYGFLAAFGFSALTGLLLDNVLWLQIAGGLFLLYLGMRTLRSKPAEKAAEVTEQRGGLWGAYLSTFLLTLTNPMTILAFVSIFAGLSSASGSTLAESLTTVAGIFVGSALWWLLLSGGVSLFREKTDAKIMRWISIASGLIICFFALRILLQASGLIT